MIDGATEDAAKAAMTAYLGRGGGRSAQGAKAILQAHGLAKISGAPANVLPALINAFNAA